MFFTSFPLTVVLQIRFGKNTSQMFIQFLPKCKSESALLAKYVQTGSFFPFCSPYLIKTKQFRNIFSKSKKVKMHIYIQVRM